MERRTVEGVHFIRVKGVAVERARQHVALLREEVREGALGALAKKNEWLIRRAPGVLSARPINATLVWAYKNLLLPMLDRSMDDETRALIRALEKESGLSYAMLRESLLQPDALMLLSRTSIFKYLLKHLPAGGLPGCTSGIALKEWTRSGRLLVARNQDYPIVGPWENNTTVMFSEPTESDQIPHVSVTTAGVHTAGLTGMNREGLTLSTHAHFGKSVSLSGLPVVVVGNEVIRKAKTIGQAVDIARRQHRCANWAFVVSSAKENDAVVIEMTPRRTFVRHASDGYLGHTNYFQSPELRDQEALISGGACDDLVARLCRIRQLIEEHRGTLEPKHMTAALGDHVDWQSGEERVFGNTISVVTTIKSVVMEPGSQKLWLSSRKESPTGLGDFLEIDVDKFWSQPADQKLPTLPGWRPRNPALLDGIRHYRDAYRAWHMNCHEPDFMEKTLISLRKACSAYPGDGYLWVQTGIIEFRLQHFTEATACFRGALARTLSDHVKQVAELYLARCFDVAGERSKAKELYAHWEKVAEPKLRAAHRQGIRKPYRAGRTGSMMIDLQFPDTLQY